MKKRVLISGGTGLVGAYLTEFLISKGYKVSILSRSKKENTADVKYFLWDIDNKIIDKNCLLNVETIIHLAGENVASGRWTSERKETILKSRTESIQLIFDLLTKEQHSVKTFISASATGIYGAVTSMTNFSESNNAGTDFLAGVCEKWEASIFKMNQLGIRTVALRTGVVLSKNGGALKKMSTPFKLGLASPVASGKQYIPWIHIEDLCKMYLFSLENLEINGVYNAVVGDNLTNEEFSRAFAKVLNRPFFMPNIPKSIMKYVFGEMSVILTEGSRVSSNKIKSKGFEFSYSNVFTALNNLYK